MIKNLLKLLANGVIVLAKTEEKDEYVLFINGKEETITVPFVKIGKGSYACLDPEGREEDEYVNLTEIVESVIKGKVFKEISSFKILSKKADTKSKTITDFVSGAFEGSRVVLPENIMEICTKSGFALPIKEVKAISKKDYSKIKEDPEYKIIFEKDESYLKSRGIVEKYLDPQWKTIEEMINTGDTYSFLVLGPAGTGKTDGARFLANKYGSPFKYVQVGEATEESSLNGTYVPNEHESGFHYVIGPLLLAYTLGLWIFIDEINRGRPTLLALFNQVTDGSPYIIYEGKTYWRHPNFVIGFGMNPGYRNTTELDESLKNRLPKIIIGKWGKSKFTSVLQDYSKKRGYTLSTDFCEKLYDFSNEIEKQGNGSGFHESLCLSIRQAQMFASPILAKRRTFEEFYGFLQASYINNLTCDNDNVTKVQALVESKDMVEKAKQLYDLYGMADMKKTPLSMSLKEIFAEGATDDESDDSFGKSSGEDYSDLDLNLDRFEL